MSIATIKLTIKHCAIEISYNDYEAQQGNPPHSLAVWVPAPFTPHGEPSCSGYAPHKAFATTSGLMVALEREVERLEGLIAIQDARVECSRDAHERMIQALQPVPATASLPAICLEARANLLADLTRDIRAMQSHNVNKGRVLDLLAIQI